MTEYKDQKASSFGGTRFPWERFSIHGGLDDHVHKTPHAKGGGKPEKMGRRLYEIEFEIPAYDSLLQAQFQDFWPRQLNELRRKFERQETDELHIPSIGTIRAYCFDWGQNGEAKHQNGAKASWKFREHPDDSDELTKSLDATSAARMQSLATSLEEQATEAGSPGLFDSLVAAVDSVLAVRDQATMRATLLESKLNYLTYLCTEADRTIELFNDPSNWRMLEALKELWAAAKALAANFTEEAADIGHYVTPTLMTVTEVSIAIYGDASRAMDILNLNPIPDPLEIKPGTKLAYFK